MAQTVLFRKYVDASIGVLFIHAIVDILNSVEMTNILKFVYFRFIAKRTNRNDIFVIFISLKVRIF